MSWFRLCVCALAGLASEAKAGRTPDVRATESATLAAAEAVKSGERAGSGREDAGPSEKSAGPTGDSREDARPMALPAKPGPTAAAASEAAGSTARRVIVGVIQDPETGRRVAGATVVVAGTPLYAQSATDGTFRIEGVLLGDLVLQVTKPGFTSVEKAVKAGEREVLVEMTISRLEEIVVLGRATAAARKYLPHTVATVRGDELSEVSAQTIDEALQGRVVGANIQSNSGAPGGGMQLRLRGVSTIKGRSEPLYVLDGVILSDSAIPSGISAVTGSNQGSNPSALQDDQVNRIADLNPNDIASIEVLKGASAAAIYGSKANNGVVIITTKSGRAGEPRISYQQRFGFYQLANKLGARTFETVEEAVDVFGPEAGQRFVPGRTFDHEQQLAGRTDLSWESGLSVSGIAGETDYFASLFVKDDAGIIRNTGYEKQAGRLNIGHQFGKRLRLEGMTTVIHSLAQRSIANNDNEGVSHYMVLPFTPSFVDLRSRNGIFPENPFIGSTTNPLQTRALMKNDEDVWRIIGALNGRLDLYSDADHDLELVGLFGVDHFQQRNDLFFPPELHFEPTDGLPGTSLDGESESLNYNWGLNLIYTYEPSSGFLTATSSGGVQYEERGLETIYIVSRNLNGGRENLGSGTAVSVTEHRELVKDRGFYIQEELLLLDGDLALVGSLRAEQSSANGDADKLFFYPKLAAAHSLPPLSAWIDDLKTRVAYGESGNQPLFGQKFVALDPTHNIEGRPGLVVLDAAGDPEIRPERQREIEGGVDIVSLEGRAVLELTLYQRTISDLLLERTLAPSTGIETQFFNGGTLRNRGIEVMLELTPLRSESYRWLSRTAFALNRSKVLDLDVPAFTFGGFGTSLGAFRIEEGASATQIVGSDGPRQDGTCCEVRKIGDTEPTFRMFFYNSVEYRDFGVSLLVDWQQGSQIVNLTRFLYDLGQNTVDFVEAGPDRLERNRFYADAYLEDATFLKVREVSIYYDVPEELLSGWLGVMRSARVSLSARNLLTFTTYSGLDPEVSNFGNQPIERNIDVAPFPPSRSFWLSFNLGF